MPDDACVRRAYQRPADQRIPREVVIVHAPAARGTRIVSSGHTRFSCHSRGALKETSSGPSGAPAPGRHPPTRLCCMDTRPRASMDTNALLRTMLALAHLLCELYAAIRRACDTAYRWCTDSWCAGTTAELDALVRAYAKTRKVPRHLVIVLGLCDESVLDCVRIIGWCITLDIPYISFFDRNGFLKKNETNLKEEFARRRPDLVEHIIWNSHAKAPSQNGVTGSRSKINVSLLSDVDSKGKIVTLTQSLAEAVSSGNLDPEEITDQLISEKLQMKGMPDPDLALIYGYTCSTHGLLPWHTRTTEFLMLPLYVSISAKDFAYLLEKYSKCVQRYGK